MTAGPTPVPPAVSQAMAAPMLYHRAPAFDELYERVLGRLPRRLPDREPGARVRRERLGRDGVGRRQPRPPRHEGARARRAGKFGERWIQLCEAYGADLVRHEPGWGVRFDPADVDRLLARAPRRRGRLRDAVGDLDRHRARRPGDRRGRPPPRRAARRRRGLGPRRRAAGAGRVGRRRRRRRLAEGADDAARAGVRLGLASARSRPRPRTGGGRYYFDWARTAKSQAKGASPFTPAVSLFLGLDVALEMIEAEGLEDVWARHDVLARATRAGALALGLDLYGDPDERSTVVTAIELPGDVDGGKVPGALRKLGHHRQRRPGPPQGPDPADRALRLLRRVRHPHVALGPRDRAAAARPRRRAGRRRRRRAARLPRGRRARRRVSLLGEQYRVLVAEQIADSGVDLLRERFEVDVGTGWSPEELAERIGGLSRDPDPVGDAADGGADRRGRTG